MTPREPLDDLDGWTCEGQSDLLDELAGPDPVEPNPDDARDLTIDDDLLDGAS